MNDARFDNMPLILETPEESLWEQEIKKLYSLVTK
jgi:deoxyribonuclease-4